MVVEISIGVIICGTPKLAVDAQRIHQTGKKIISALRLAHSRAYRYAGNAGYCVGCLIQQFVRRCFALPGQVLLPGLYRIYNVGHRFQIRPGRIVSVQHTLYILHKRYVVDQVHIVHKVFIQGFLISLPIVFVLVIVFHSQCVYQAGG